MSIEKRNLGKTGERLSIIGLGGIVLCGMEQEQANAVVSEAVDRGVSYFDVAPSYGNGEAEEKLGPALAPYRDRVFLACKTGARDKDGAAQELERSLVRLQTDHLDLYQFHGFENTGEVEKALGPGGAIETFCEAREKGLIRFIGFSAHSVEAALLAMDRFPFDTVLFPINWACMLRGDFGPQVLKRAEELGIGRLALKAMARTHWPEGMKRDYEHCWYLPMTDPVEASLALRFTLSQPITAAIPPGDVRLFRIALSAAERYEPITGEELEKLKAMSCGVEPIFRL